MTITNRIPELLGDVDGVEMRGRKPTLDKKELKMQVSKFKSQCGESNRTSDATVNVVIVQA